MLLIYIKPKIWQPFFFVADIAKLLLLIVCCSAEVKALDTKEPLLDPTAYSNLTEPTGGATHSAYL